MRIALDFDGTISDLLGGYVLYALEHFDIELPRERGVGQRPPFLGEQRHREMAHAVLTTEFALRLDPLPGAVAAIHRLGREHELYIVTARNEEEGRWAERWLDLNSIAVQGVTATNRRPKLEACRTLGASLLLDDSPAAVEELHGSDVTPVLMDAPYNRAATLPPGVVRVPGWPEFEALCANMDMAD